MGRKTLPNGQSLVFLPHFSALPEGLIPPSTPRAYPKFPSNVCCFLSSSPGILALVPESSRICLSAGAEQ